MLSDDRAAAITGYGIEIPGLGEDADLVALRPLPNVRTFDAARTLGRKGLLYKDHATRLGLCAVFHALTRADLPVRDLHNSAPTGVVVSSNLGNVDTVCRMIEALYGGSAADLSPMDAPNASSNVIASNIAIRFGCHGLNLTMCSGATSGTDALFVAACALRTRRAARMIVVGVEPQNEYVQRLAEASLGGPGQAAAALHVGEGAACVILEPLGEARARNATIHGVIDTNGYVGARVARRPPGPPDLWLTPNRAWPTMQALSDDWLDFWGAHPPSTDLSETLGELYGALGVLQCVAACAWLARPDTGAAMQSALATSGGSWGDGVASLTIRRPA